MHFHLPKPLHGWREFAGEVGIIVLGVLIALTAEQVVEDLQWQLKVRDAKTSIHKDLALATVFAEERQAQRDCTDAYLAHLAAAIVASPAQWRPRRAEYCGATHTAVYEGNWRPWPTEGWQSIEADGTVSHFGNPYRQQAPFLFNYIRTISDLSLEERDLGTKLEPLGDPLVLTPDGKLALLQTIAALRALNHRLALYSEGMRLLIAALGESPSKAELAYWHKHVPDLFVRPGQVRNVTHELPSNQYSSTPSPSSDRLPT